MLKGIRWYICTFAFACIIQIYSCLIPNSESKCNPLQLIVVHPEFAQLALAFR